MLFFLPRPFPCYTDHYLLQRSKIHPSLFHQNHNAFALHSISVPDQAIAYPTLLPVRHTCQQSFAAIHHCFFVLSSKAYSAHCWLIHCHEDQTSSMMATTTG